MNPTPEGAKFVPFAKISHLKSPCIITEKIDGTNACLEVTETSMTACSRTRRLVTTYADAPTVWYEHDAKGRPVDNYGFGAWAAENSHLLARLAPGRHFGEWYGRGIQRGYGLPVKKLAFFNTSMTDPKATLPELAEVVRCTPVLYEGEFSELAIENAMATLMVHGSYAAPGCMHPEGVVVHFLHNRTSFKVVFDGKGGWARAGQKVQAA